MQNKFLKYPTSILILMQKLEYIFKNMALEEYQLVNMEKLLLFLIFLALKYEIIRTEDIIVLFRIIQNSEHDMGKYPNFSLRHKIKVSSKRLPT